MTGGEVTVGVDIGTTSVKALAVDADGTVLASARVPHPLRAAPGRLEHDAEAAWRAGVRRAYREVTAAGAGVRAVAVSAMVPSLTAVDAAGRPVAPGLLYGDARGSGEGSGGGAGRPGADPAASGEAAGFLRWLAAEAPGAAGFWPAQAVANQALGGRAALDFATAWCTGSLFDGQGWSAPALASSGVRPEQLPDVVAGDEPVGRVGDAPGGPLIGPGTVDALAAQYVAGADTAGDVLVILGATLIVWTVMPGWVERPGLWTVPHTAPGLCLVGGASNAGGLFVDWAGRLLAEPPPAAAAGEHLPRALADDVRPVTVTGAGDEEAAAGGESWPRQAHRIAGRGATDTAVEDVPVWLPYVRGERTPLHDPGARAELSGLHIGHGPAELWRAAHEASGFVARRIVERAHTPVPAADPAAPASPLRPQRIVAVGGGVRAPGWVQALADCTGLEVHVGAVPDASALGAAFVARCTAGLESAPSAGRRWARTGTTVAPDPAWLDACHERYQRFLARSRSAEAGSTA